MDRRVVLFLCAAALSGCEGLRVIHQPFMNSATPPQDAVVAPVAVPEAGAGATLRQYRAGQALNVRLADSVINGEVQSVEAYDSAAGLRCQRVRLQTGSGPESWVSCDAGDQAEWSRDLTHWGRGS